MKRLTILLILISQSGFGQSKLLTETINSIDFQEDTIQSVFFWIADNIKYDVKKFNAIKDRSASKSRKKSNFKNEKEYNDHLLEKALKYKKGVCEDYSLLFKSILEELGFEAYIIEGYTKFDGKVSKKVGHAWNAVKINEEWKLFDATWAAGVVENEKKFVKNYSAEWYDVPSEEMIKTHMPFDPIWQLLKSPMTYATFEEKPDEKFYSEDFQFDKLIDDFLVKEPNLQMKEQVERSEAMGQGIRMIDKWRKNMTKLVGLYGITSQQDLLDNAHETSQHTIDLFNDYIKAKNKQFKSKKYPIEKAEQNLIIAKEETEEVLAFYQGIEVEDKKAQNSINKAIRFSEKILKKIDREIKFLNELESR